MRLVSWNVNGIRACARKGMLKWLAISDAEILGLQETRAELDEWVVGQFDSGAR